jgi:hypothetical protein
VVLVSGLEAIIAARYLAGCWIFGGARTGALRFPCTASSLLARAFGEAGGLVSGVGLDVNGYALVDSMRSSQLPKHVGGSSSKLISWIIFVRDLHSSGIALGVRHRQEADTLLTPEE